MVTFLMTLTFIMMVTFSKIGPGRICVAKCSSKIKPRKYRIKMDNQSELYVSSQIQLQATKNVHTDKSNNQVK